MTETNSIAVGIAGEDYEARPNSVYAAVCGKLGFTH